MYGIAAKVVKKQTKQLNHSKLSKQEKKKYNDEQFRRQAAGIQKQVDALQIKGKIARQNNYNELENKIALSQQLIQKYRQQMQNINPLQQENEKPKKKSLVKSNLSNSRSSIFSTQTKSPMASDHLSRNSTTSIKSSKKSSKNIKLQKSPSKNQKLYSSQNTDVDVTNLLTAQQQLEAEKNYNKSYINSINNEISQIKSMMKSDEELDGSMSHISAFSRKSFSNGHASGVHSTAEYSQSQGQDTGYYNLQTRVGFTDNFQDQPTYGEQEKPVREQITDLKQIIEQMRAEKTEGQEKSHFKQKFTQHLSNSINQRIKDAKNDLENSEIQEQIHHINEDVVQQLEQQQQELQDIQTKQQELVDMFNDRMEQVGQDQLVLKQNLLSYQTDNNEAKQIIIDLQRQILEQQQNIEQLKEELVQSVQTDNQGLSQGQLEALFEQQKEYLDAALMAFNDNMYKIRKWIMKNMMKQKLYNKILFSHQKDNQERFTKIENVIGEVVNQQETLLILNQKMHESSGNESRHAKQTKEDLSDIQAQQKIQEELNNQYFTMYNQQINDIKSSIKQLKREIHKHKKQTSEGTLSNQSGEASKDITSDQVAGIESKISSLESQISFYQNYFREFIKKYNADMELIASKLNNDSSQ